MGEELIMNEWTDLEFEETVKAYLWMLGQETKGKQYNKSEVNKQLRESALSARSKASIEYRMQNISAVFKELCFPWIVGYKPAVNVGPEGREKIKLLAAKLGVFNPADYSPTADPIELEEKVRKVRKKITTSGIPKGEDHPKQTVVSSSVFNRDPLVKAWVLENAKGKCEACGVPAPFVTIYDQPFLEVHHLKLLADGGTDTITNAAGLCPNCHRGFHLSKDKDEIVKKLFSKVSRLVSE
jgi:5-methylcytosine-specific restriction protein A